MHPLPDWPLDGRRARRGHVQSPADAVAHAQPHVSPTRAPSPAPTLAPTLDGLAALSGELGLPLVGDLDVVDAPYPERPGALREESAWRAGFFVARRAE